MSISLASFGLTIAIGLPFLLLIACATCEAGAYPKLARAYLSVIAALMITPTLWQPFHVLYIEAASVVVFCALVGLTHPAFAALWGGLPILCVAILIYFGWNRWKPVALTKRSSRQS